MTAATPFTDIAAAETLRRMNRPATTREDHDMTPIEIRDALREITKEAGPQAWADADINANRNDDRVIKATLYPQGISGRGDHAIRVTGLTFAEAIMNLRDAWERDRALVDKNTIRKMALAIIEITTDQGGCSDAALRGAGFAQHQIDAMGAMACDEATTLAAGGPFSIRATFGANAEAA